MEQEHIEKKDIFKDRGIFVTVLVVIISLVSGAIGGAGGVLYLSRQKEFQKWLDSSSSLVTNQRITVLEDNAVIDVVKKAGPAVVSVIISKDINKYNRSPFSGDPFAPFFGFGDSRLRGDGTPNIQQVGAGSGFFVSKDGLILTNKHVIEDEQASYSVVMNNHKTYDAKVLARDPVNDLAILKIDITDAPTLELADSSNLQVGQRVIAIGNSLGQYQNMVTTGIVSGIGRSITAGGGGTSESLEGVIQTDAAINPGNSGGPLLNALGQVIGINTAIDREGQLVGFAIPSTDASRSLDSYRKSGKITRAYLGVRYVMISKSLAKNEKLPKDHGALITRGEQIGDVSVIPGSPADKAGLVENDIILAVNGSEINEDSTLAGQLRKFKVGDTVELTVFHKDSEKKVKVTLEESK